MSTQPPKLVVIGGGPAGLMAAEQLTQAGHRVDLYDAMPTVGRKFLLAGIGGMNITHSEPFNAFCQRYAERQTELTPLLQQFGATELRQWCQQLGIETFVGTSGRVFPKEMKAAPLLRAWLARLKAQGLQIHPRQRWLGWNAQGELLFAHQQQQHNVAYDGVVLALGGGSWKKLGSDGSWLPLLAAKGVKTQALQATNCGFLCQWSEHLQQRVAGAPVKSVTLSFTDLTGSTETRMGELILTERGVEGSLIYAFAARLREYINTQGKACFYLDLLPNHTAEQVLTLLQKKPRNKSLGAYLKNRFKLDTAKATLLFEYLPKDYTLEQLAQLLKAIPITVHATTPIDEAISTAGGVDFAALDQNYMLQQLPGVFCAGEMLDWEAPTGGYLLTACFATGRHAGQGVLDWLQGRTSV